MARYYSEKKRGPVSLFGVGTGPRSVPLGGLGRLAQAKKVLCQNDGASIS